MILKIFTNTGKVSFDLDVVQLELILTTNAGQEQDLRRPNGSSRQDDLLLGFEVSLAAESLNLNTCNLAAIVSVDLQVATTFETCPSIPYVRNINWQKMLCQK